MGTELRVDQKPTIWNVLPLHPRPEVLESITGYITRLAEANGLQSINELGALVGGMRLSSLKKNPDYPTVVYPGLAPLTGHSEEAWLDMTFFHLIHYFGVSMNTYALHRFLAGSFASHLRYCPVCLAERTPTYYSLLWRFLLLPGCSEHGVRFLDQCGHCGSPMPIFRPVPHLTRCPLCRGDLRTCKPARLDCDEREPREQRTRDLSLLLTPGHWPLWEEQAKLIGRRFQMLRQQRDLWIPEVAQRLGLATSIIGDIEYVNRFRQASLKDYMQYAALLGYSFCEIFDEQSLETLAEPMGEEGVLELVETAIRQCRARGKAVLPGRIGDLVGTTGSRLKLYPRVKKLLDSYEAQRKQEAASLDPLREEGLVKQIEEALRRLEACGEPIVLQHVCDLVGISYSWIVKKSPRIRELFCEYQKNRASRGLSARLDEEAKVQRVQAAINMLVSQGEAVTLRRIRQIVRLTQKQLRHSPRIKALLAPYTGKWQGEAS
jgi:transcriptional regulator with XRE-family HTH domain